MSCKFIRPQLKVYLWSENLCKSKMSLMPSSKCVRLYTTFRTKILSASGFSASVILFPDAQPTWILRFTTKSHQAINTNEVPNVPLSKIKSVLQSHSLRFQDGFSCLTIQCPLCQDKKQAQMYINKTTGFFTCNHCKNSGQWAYLLKILGTRDNYKLKRQSPINKLPLERKTIATCNKWNEMCSSTKCVISLPTDRKKLVLEKFQAQGIPENVLSELDVRVDETGSFLYVPLRNGSEVVGFKELKANGEELTVPPHSSRGLITLAAQNNNNKPAAVLVPAVKDFLALSKLRIAYDVICLPHDHVSLPQEVLPLLERYERLILWFGNGGVACDSVLHCAKKLGEKRCYFVRPTKDCPAPHLADSLKLAQIIKEAQSILHPAITSFQALREEIRAELQNKDQMLGVKWKRFPILSQLLGGHRRGELTILTGPTGCGKTTFISEYSIDLAAQGVATLWGSFEIRNQRLLRTMLQQFSLLELDAHMDKFDLWADRFEQLPLHFMTFHGQQPLKVIMEAVEHATYVHDIAHVLVDNLQFMMGVGGDNFQEQFHKQDTIIAAFRNFAFCSNVHVTMVIHPRKERSDEQLTANSIFGSAKAAQEADNVLIIQLKQMQSLKIKKYLQVAKNRYTGELGVMPLDFDKTTLSYSQKGHAENVAEAEKEVQQYLT